MGYNLPDVYNQPDKFGIELLGSVDLSEPNYDFDLFVVWRRPDVNGYEYGWLSDAGCSCPSPFEDYNSVDDIFWGTREEVADAFENVLQGGGYTASERASAHGDFFEIIIKMING